MKTAGPLLVFALSLCMVPAAWAQKGKPQPPPPCGADIPLSVTIEDVPSGVDSPNYAHDGIEPLGLGYKLVSDGGGPYVNGVSRVAATIGRSSCLFNFKLNLPSSRHVQLNDTVMGASRELYFLNFGRIGSVPITVGNDVALNQFCDGGVDKSTFQSAAPQDNYGGCGSDGDGTRYVLRYAGGTIEDRSPHYKLRYHLDQVDGDSLDSYNGDCDEQPALCEVAWVRVYHPDADTWIITPHDDSPRGPAAAAFWELVKKGSGQMLFDALPFRMTLRRLP